MPRKEIEKNKYYDYLWQYLHVSGAEIRADGQMRCPEYNNHKNSDSNFSAKYYANKGKSHARVKCHGCGGKWDIYDLSGVYNNTSDFIEQYNIIDGLFGNGEVGESGKHVKPEIVVVPKEPKQNKNVDYEKEHVVLTPKKTREVFTRESVKYVTKSHKDEVIRDGEICKFWIYTDKDNNTIAVDARFEKEVEVSTKSNETEDKTTRIKRVKKVVTFWYNGISIKYAGSFNIIYNLYDIIKETKKPIIIHEGAKCASIGKKNMDEFVHISYNRGSNHAGKIDWSIISDRKVYILQDNDSEGFKAASSIKNKLQNAIILKSIYMSFDCNNIHGADIEQLLEYGKHDEISKYILSYSEEIEKEEINKFGIKTLGIDDNDKLFFTDRFSRLFECKRDGLNKQKLMDLAPLDYWMQKYSNSKGTIQWDEAIEYVLQESEEKEFDSKRIRGRGAWRDNGKIIYHDGKETFGSVSGDFTYLRKNKHDIGIHDNKATRELLNSIRELCKHISFENQSDVARCLGWSILAPFCGALFWRPCVLLTGESGSGKTTVLEKIILPLTQGKHYNAHHTSIAGIRADVKNDSCAILLEEAEGSGSNKSNFDKEGHRNNLFSLMRASSSDDAPESVKSNSEQGVVRYQMKNMFLFVSITPTISDIADDNRIFKVNFVAPHKKKFKVDNVKDWEDVENELGKLLSKSNTRNIRAFTWSLLPKIISDTKIITKIMKYTHGKSSRIASGESFLISAYMNLFSKTGEVNEKSIENLLNKYYNLTGVDDKRDDSDELLHNILDHTVQLQIDRYKKDLAVVECICCLVHNDFSVFNIKDVFDSLSTGEVEEKNVVKIIRKEIIRTLKINGLAITKEDHLAIRNNSNTICKILGKEYGYHKIFNRLDICINSSKNVYFLKNAHKSTIIDITQMDFYKEGFVENLEN